MTPRAIVTGLILAAGLGAFNYVNDNILRQTYLIGHALPFAVYGGLIAFAALLNPVLRRLHRSLAYGPAEAAVVLTMVLASCCVPSSGLMRTFTQTLILPHHVRRLNPGWRENEIVEMMPKHLLAQVAGNEDRVLNGYVQGLGGADASISLADIPWDAWAPPLLYWIPAILALWFGLLALALVLHRQWSQHELLPYPVADFADALLPKPGGGLPDLLRTRGFWIAAGMVFAIHFNNYLHTFFPDIMIPFQRRPNLTPLARFIPYLTEGGGTRLLRPAVYFSVIGFAFFIPTDVSLSIGIGPFLWAIVVGVFMIYGIPLAAPLEGAGWYLVLNARAFLLFGANLAVLAVIVYCGRRHYWHVAKAAVGLRTPDTPSGTAWAARFSVALLALFALRLTQAGLDWQLSLAYTAIMVIFYVVMSRIFAETGLFYIQPFFFPCIILWGLFGAQALGPRTVLVMCMVTAILIIDPRESLMPFMVNSLKVLETRRVALGRTSVAAAVAVLVGLAVALPVSLWFQYDRGYPKWDGWAGRAVPQMPFDNALMVKEKLAAQGSLDTAMDLHGWQRFAHVAPNRICLVAMAAGLILALGCYMGRLRVPSWPIHPVLFLTWATEPTWRLCGAFLMGWACKALVVKYGGSRWYQRLRPAFLGLVAGEIFGAVIPTVCGVFYYLITGLQPPTFWVLPLLG